MSRRARLLRALEHLSPAIARPSLIEALRSGIGAGLALGLLALGLWAAHLQFAAQSGLMLIAPLGATAFLLFAVPNSPLAQPWPALVGNVASALVAIWVVKLGLPVSASVALAVGLAVVVMALARAMHPPGAAVALAAVLAPDQTLALGWGFAVMPVALDTVALIAMAVLWNTATGRVYPFRLPVDAPLPPTPQRAALPDTAELEALLAQMNLTPNIGVEDLTRVLEVLEQRHPHATPATATPRPHPPR